MVVRRVLTPNSLDYLNSSGGVAGILEKIPEAIRYWMHGAYKGFAISFSGGLPSRELFAAFLRRLAIYQHGSTIYMTLFLLVLGYSISWKKSGIGRFLPLLICFALWFGVLYFLPVIPRMPFGFRFFINADRYRYLPGIPAGALAVMVAASLRPLLYRPKYKIAFYCWIAFLCVCVIGNHVQLHRKVHGYAQAGLQAENVRRTFSAELNRVLEEAPGVIPLYNGGISKQLSNFRIEPDSIVRMYFAPEAYDRIEFLEPGVFEKEMRLRPVYMVRVNGEIYRMGPGIPLPAYMLPAHKVMDESEDSVTTDTIEATTATQSGELALDRIE